jgi:peptidoglycan/xylan/chitin deacetylase (PgdA/CDA1 family)
MANDPPRLAPPRRPAGNFRRLLRRVASRLPTWSLVLSGPQSQRRIAFTFDDGPDDRTLEYLAVLAAQGVKATFFVIGSQAKARPDLIRKIVEAGHEVAGHGLTHRTFPSLSPGTLRAELRETEAVLPRPDRGRPLVRPPRGAITLRSLAVTIWSGFTTVLWSIDSDDCRSSDPADLIERLRPEQLRAGDIVLLHENQTWDLEALPQIIERLHASGFQLVTVSELLR